MAYTYTLTMDAGTGPWQSGIGFINQCNEETIPFTEVFPNINALAQFVGFHVSEFYVGGTYSYTINGTVITWTWTWTEDPNTTECRVFAAVFAPEFVTFWAPFVPVEVEVCPTCQDLIAPNCTDAIDIIKNIPEGLYQLQIVNHQTNVNYLQNVYFNENGQGSWVTSNMPGVFNPFDIYTMTILDTTGNPVSWLDGDKEYSCMRLTFATFTDTTPQG